MNAEKVVPVVISVLVIVVVAMLQEKSRYFAAVVAVMPLSAPLAMWVVFSATNGDYQQTMDFVGSMVIGMVATFLFVVACWLALRQRWSFPVALLFGGAAWLASVLLPALARRWMG